MVSTTIAVGSNGAVLPQATINVASTTNFNSSGTIYVRSSNGVQTITYTGTTATTFTGCSGGTGTLATGNFVSQSQERGNLTIYFDINAGFTPAVISTDQTTNPGSFFPTNRGLGSNSYTYVSFSTNGRDFSRIAKFAVWYIVDSSGNVPSVPSTKKYYKMVGYNTVSQAYESFVSVGAPTSATTVNPNTGNTLINTYVSAFWQITS